MTESELSHLRRRVADLAAENETLRQGGQQGDRWADSAGRWSQAVVKLISDLCNEVAELKRRVGELEKPATGEDFQHGFPDGETP